MLIFMSMQPLSLEPIISAGGIAPDIIEAGGAPPGFTPAQSGPEHCSDEEGAPPFD